MGYVYILLTVAFTVYGQVILKQQLNTLAAVPSGYDMFPFFIKLILTRPLLFSGFISGVFASVMWMAALTKFELSYAYPFMSLNFVVVVLLSIILFNENLNIYKLMGIGIICVGVWVLSKGV